MSKTDYPDGHQDGELLSIQLVDDMHINHSGKNGVSTWFDSWLFWGT